MTIIREPMINKDWWTKRFVSKKEFIGFDERTHEAVYVENEFVEERTASTFSLHDFDIRICSQPGTIYKRFNTVF